MTTTRGLLWKPLTRTGPQERTLELLLRVGVAGCYIGHGAFGIITKAAWLPYFAVAGIGEDLAWSLMPLIGTVDIVVGLLVLMAPRPALLFYAATWGVWTALLRPLSGDSFFETLERAGNYGVPIAFLVLGAVSLRPTLSWFKTLNVPPLTTGRRHRIVWVLRVTTATLLAGHGALAFTGKPLLAQHLATIGLPEGSLALMGAVEIGLALAILLRASPGLLLFVLAWKLASEALFPLSGAPFWEFVERAGSYIAPLALWTLVRTPVATPLAGARRSAAVSAGVLVTLAAGLIGAAIGFGVQGGEAAPPPPPAAESESLLERLRAGGLVLACRHAHTDRSRGDRQPVDFSDPSTQRLLSRRGRAQARRLGEEIRRLGIPIGTVLTSPYARAEVTAELAFGDAAREEGLYQNPRQDRARTRRLFASLPPSGTNRVLVSHRWVLHPALPTVENGSIREGDCVVLDPDGESFDVLARLGPDDFAGLEGAGSVAGEGRQVSGGHSSQERSLPRDLIARATAGGVHLVCRHARTGPDREREPVDYADSTTQRLLSPAGERQARDLGQAIMDRGVPVGRVVASPMNRARRTAWLMFGREPVIDSAWHTNGGSYRGPALEARRAALRRSPGAGTDVTVSHIGTIRSVLGEVAVSEGACAVVEPTAEGFQVAGVLASRDWKE